MALIQKKISNKKQATLVAALVGVLVVTGAVLYFGLLKEPSSALRTSSERTDSSGSGIPSAPQGQAGIDSFSELSNSPVFQRLQKFGVWPLATEPRGRTEPFTVIFE